MRNLVCAAGLCTCVMLSGTAFAGNGGLWSLTTAPPMFVALNVTIPANTLASFTTYNLSPGSDTVVHVQDAQTGAYLTGDDDCDGPESCAYLGPASSPRTVTVVVRAYSESLQGTAMLSIYAGSELLLNRGPFDFGVKFTSIGPMSTGGHITTVRRLNETYDTVLLAFGDPFEPHKAIAFDDDNGARYMSHITLPANSSGLVAVGSFNTTFSGPTEFRSGCNLLWDDDVHRLDGDNDGVGKGLENFLGTSDSDWDNDDDGIPDLQEVLPWDVSDGSAIELPTWGAKPTQKDIFLEADWLECPTTDPACTSVDQNKMTPAAIERLRAAFWGPTTGTNQPAPDHRIAIHVDNGMDNRLVAGQPNTLTQWGDWGGAQRIPYSDAPCDTLGLGSRATGRAMFFQTYVSHKGGTGYKFGHCSVIRNDGNVAAHELGHNLGLEHSGMPGAGYKNGKPIYQSVMNYMYQELVPYFSVANFRGVELNPAGINESKWRGTNTTGDLGLIAQAGFKVSGSKVDWNQDGEFQTGYLRTRANFKWDLTLLREHPSPNGLAPNSTDPTMTWYRSPLGNRLYIFYRGVGATYESPGPLKYRYSSNVNSDCASYVNPVQLLNSPCGTFTEEFTVSGAGNIVGAPSAFEFTDNDGKVKLMIGYRLGDRSWQMQAMYVETSGAHKFGAPILSQFGGTTAGFSGAMSGVYDASTQRIDWYHILGGAMVRSSYDVKNAKWVAVAAPQDWSAAGNPGVVTKGGVGLTWGKFKGSSTSYLVAAIPGPAPGDPIALARRMNTSNRWELMSNVPLATDVRPGLAFQSLFGGSGRYYVLSRDAASGRPVLNWSEGNDTSTSATKYRIRQWEGGDATVQEDWLAPGAAALVFDASLDVNLRAAMSSGFSSVWFMGIADGVVNASLKDENDYEMMSHNLHALFHGGVQACYGIDSQGSCTDWR